MKSKTAISSEPVPPDVEQLARLIAEARVLALAYRNLTGRPLGVTGEVGEFEAIRLLGLELAPVRSPGFDARDKHGKTYQVKARCVPRSNRSQRLGAIKIESTWDAALMVLLDEELTTLGIWQAERSAVIEALDAPGSKARNERRALSVSKFKAIGRQVWPAEASRAAAQEAT